MRITIQSMVFACLLAIFCVRTFAVSDSLPMEPASPPKLISSAAFSYPMEGYLQGSPTGGFARLLVEIDSQGSVVDGVCVEATNHAFADAATRGLFASSFLPAQEGGAAIAVRTELVVHFEITGIRTINSMDDVSLKRHSIIGDVVEFALTDPISLDEPIEVIERGEVYGLKDDEGQRVNGSARIRVIIDTAGQVRMPYVLESSDPVIAAHALQTLKQWKFKSPLKEGKPTITKVVIPISF